MEAALDLFTRENTEAEVGFIHGEDVIDDLGNKPDALGFYMPPISKDSVFESIVRYGAYPRKSISIGHADEKRYYMECRKPELGTPLTAVILTIIYDDSNCNSDMRNIWLRYTT